VWTRVRSLSVAAEKHRRWSAIESETGVAL
jgi:hypothetical protein